MKINTLAAGLISALLIVSATSCKKGFKTSDDGLRYMYLVESDTGEVAGEGGFLKFNIEMKTAKDSIIQTTYKANSNPFEMLLPKSEYDGDIFSGLAMLKAGDSVQFKLKADSFYLKTMRQELPPSVKGDEDVTVTVNVLESKSKETFDKWQKEQKDKEVKADQEQLAKEKKQLEEAAAKLGLKDSLKTTAGGVMYAIVKRTNGKQGKSGDIGQFYYRGTLLNGTEFDGNIGNGKDPYPVTIGGGGVIPGWMEVVDKMKIGEKWMVFIPSGMAYGKEGSGPDIGPNTPLMFEMELAALKTREELQKEEEAKMKKLKAAEKQKLASFIPKYKNLQKETVDSATFYYIIEKQGQGNMPKDGDIMKVNVKVTDLSGNIVQNLTTPPNEPAGVRLEVNAPGFQALHKTLQKMNKGSKARIISPSKLFQGEITQGPIQSYTPVMIEIEVVDIEKPGQAQK